MTLNEIINIEYKHFEIDNFKFLRRNLPRGTEEDQEKWSQ
jgi:hypothetical protein